MDRITKDFVYDVTTSAPKNNKEMLIAYISNKYKLTQDRRVYYSSSFAVRVSYSKNKSFSNTVLSLSMLQKYDNRPFFVILVRSNGDNVMYLANTTFLKKISHSSKDLSVNNIVGSFNGSDIIKEFNNLSNFPENFEELFTIHSGLDWEDNLLRLVEASSNIKPTAKKFEPNDMQRANILNSVALAEKFVSSPDLIELNNDLNERCKKCEDAILIASHIENVNIRERLIEYLITTDDATREGIYRSLKNENQNIPSIETHDELGDYARVFGDCNTLTDIKTKVIYLNSAPKAYNIDKFLAKMSEGNTVFFFFFIGINEKGILNTVLCSVYHRELIDASIVQHHWAGRTSRGVVQFSGKHLNNILKTESFKNDIDEHKAKQYLENLLSR